MTAEFSATSDATGDESPSPPAAVLIALSLGWEMTELFGEARIHGRGSERCDDLPTLSDLLPWQATELRIATVAASVHLLTPSITATGLSVPSTDAVQTAFRGDDNDALQRAVYDLYLLLLRTLHAAEPNIGKALDLGRSLAYTCRRPNDADGLRSEFQRYRLATLQGWLADLASVLPDHAARSVAISLELWQRYVPDPGGAVDSWQITDEEVHTALRQLHRQAKIWRAVLAGEKRGRDMLQPLDYIRAAGRLLGRTLRLAWTFNLRTAFAGPILFLATGFAIWTILTSGGQTATKIAGALAAAAAGVGISWTSTKATLGQLAVKLEQPLWQAELDAAIGSAVTTLEHKRHAPRLAKIARQVSPQGPNPTLANTAPTPTTPPSSDTPASAP